MSFAAPWFLLTLATVPVYLWLRKRTKDEQTIAFTGAFLHTASKHEVSDGKQRTRRDLEDLVCCLCLVCLSLSGAQALGWYSKDVVVTNGPVDLPSELVGAPLVRAGIHPSIHTDSETILPVDIKPDWQSAIRTARKTFPDHKIHIHRAEDNLVKLQGVGVRRTGNEWLLGAEVPESLVIEARTEEGDIALRPTSGGFTSTSLTNGDWIEISAHDHRAQFLCGVGEAPLALRRGVLPEPFERGLALHPMIRLVDQGGTFELSNSASDVEGSGKAAPFPLERISVVFEEPTQYQSLALRLGGSLSLPVAQVHQWTGLPRNGTPFLFAGVNELITYERLGGAGILRVGFRTQDTDLVNTAGWPVLMMQIGDFLVKESRRCIESRVGEVLQIPSDTPITLSMNNGSKQVFEPVDGRVMLGGLDVVGLYKLEHGTDSLWLVITPSPPSGLREDKAFATPRDIDLMRSNYTLSMPFYWAAMFSLGLLLFFGRRRRWYVVAMTLLAIAPNVEARWFGGLQGVTVLMDVSPSMARTPWELKRLKGLPGINPKRVDFAGGVVKLVDLEQPASLVSSSVDLPKVLATLSSLKRGDDALVIITDGRFSLRELSYSHPVYVALQDEQGTDTRLVSATAVEMVDGIYVRATITSTGSAAGELLVRGQRQPFDFARADTQSISVMLPISDSQVELVEIRVPGDGNPSNNRLMVEVERPLRSDVLVLGTCAASLQEYLESAHRLIRFEAQIDFSRVDLAVVCDQSIEQVPPMVLGGLSKWLQNGGTLLLTGREHAFGNGGWGGSVLETLSPFKVEPEPEGRGQIHLSVGLDTSGSMSSISGGVGLAALQKVVPRWLAVLQPQDRVGVVSFDTRVHVLVDNLLVSQWRAEGWQIPSQTGGGTRLSRLVDWAVNSSIAGTRRYLLLVTDGEFADKEERVQQASRLRAAGIAVLAVGVGTDPDSDLLCALAESTGGRCLAGSVDNVTRFVSSSLVANGAKLDVPGGEVQVTPLWSLRVGGGAPNVERKVRVSAHEDARILAQQQTTPLVAERYRGLGRVIGIATDNWALNQEQWRHLLSPALNQRDVNLSISILDNTLQIKGRPNMPVPRIAPTYTIGSRRVQGSSWYLIKPGVFSSPLPEDAAGQMTATVFIGANQHQLQFDAPTEHEWTSRDSGLPALRSLTKRTNGGMVSDLDALESMIMSRARIGGVPGYFFILLGVMLWILLSVRISLGTGRASLVSSASDKGVKG